MGGYYLENKSKNFLEKMSTRDYEGWRRYGKWKKEQYENYQKQMSDREIMDAKHKSHKKVPVVKNIDQMPDQKWHRRISFIKSGIRIVGYLAIPINIPSAVALLVVSEAVGIIEELV